MKRIILLVMSVLALCGAAKADNHRVISVDKLPAEAQKFLKTHFADDKILLVTEESVLMWKEYDVIYEGGTKVSFEADGKWEEVECKQGAVKASIIPVKIAQFVQERFPAQIIKKIERDPREYEIELGNGAELKFDLEFNLIDYDD